MSATESNQFSNIAATTAAFILKGGRYAPIATFGGGDLQLQILALDGVTWINVGAAIIVRTLPRKADITENYYHVR